MESNGYFIGATGTRYAYADIAARIRKEAPHTLGKHISVQLEAIGLLIEMQNGTTPCGLPYTYAEAAISPESLDILTLRKKNREVVIQLVEAFGQWRAYQFKDQQCVNWIVTVGRRFNSRSDALQFIKEQGYVIADTQPA